MKRFLLRFGAVLAEAPFVVLIVGFAAILAVIFAPFLISVYLLYRLTHWWRERDRRLDAEAIGERHNS